MKDKKVTGWKRKIMIAVCVFLGIVLVALVAATAYLESMIGLINFKNPFDRGETLSESEYQEYLEQMNTADSNYTGPTIDEEDINWGDAGSIDSGENVINILLIGQDRREGEGRARSDSMILCTINKSAKTLTMISLMRDMYVQIPGYQDNRINASYAFGGMTLLDACIEKNFGITVDGNVEVDFSGFSSIIDELGGVEIELTASEASYLNQRGNWDFENNAGTWNLKAGMNKLNGSQAFAYSRIRQVGNGDFGRTERQRKVLNALLEMAKDMSVKELNNLLRKFLPLLTTDMTTSEIFGYALNIVPLLKDLEVSTVQIPAEGAYTMTMIRGMSVLLPDLEKNNQILEEIMKD